MDYGHIPQNKKEKNKVNSCSKCGKAHDKCADIEAIKRRQFLRKFHEFMQD